MRLTVYDESALGFILDNTAHGLGQVFGKSKKHVWTALVSQLQP
jgi:hypothetical protein